MRTRFLFFLLCLTQSTLSAQEYVVLLHGLTRTPKSMQKMKAALVTEGYTVLNFGYESTRYKIEILADTLRPRIVEATGKSKKVHFVTHSMGGILVRQIQATDPIPNIGRVVMLSPPNKGSEVVDEIGHWRLFQILNGDAGQQLSTNADSFVNQLPAIDFECGILTGNRSVNWINSSMIPGEDDGKVSVESAQIEGMSAFKIIHTTHPVIMKKADVIEDVKQFLKTGAFN